MTPLDKQAAKHRKKWEWRAFEPGETVPDAGVFIISEPIVIGPEMRNTLYDIEYACCGLKARMTHEKIRERARKKSLRCRSCGHKRTAEVRRAERERAESSAPGPLPDYGWIEPPWPKPAYVPLGYALDCDRRCAP